MEAWLVACQELDYGGPIVFVGAIEFSFLSKHGKPLLDSVQGFMAVSQSKPFNCMVQYSAYSSTVQYYRSGCQCGVKGS
jgi:hypothetical protein